jgi:hypothetical protein
MRELAAPLVVASLARVAVVVQVAMEGSSAGLCCGYLRGDGRSRKGDGP